MVNHALQQSPALTEGFEILANGHLA